jgi:dihydroorotate dehydrogenase electron transfer subunit
MAERASQAGLQAILPAMPVDADAEVLASTRLSDDYCVVAFRAPALAAAIRPGQFVMVRTAAGNTPLLRRPYSVFERLRDSNGEVIGFSILNKRVGVGSRLLYDAAPGMRVSCLGPLGRPFSSATGTTEAWMVAGGTGLAPFATLSEELAAAGVPRRLFYGARTGSELFCLDRFERLGVNVVLATEDGTRGEHGRVTVPLARELGSRPASSGVVLYACGPEAMLKAVAGLAERYGRECEVATERQMGCGMGGCYSCVVRVRTPEGGSRYARSCVEGPVFRAADIVWEDRRA